MNITVHSYKGGTGKSLIAVTLALILAMKGKRVCLIDMDIPAPSLVSSFENRKKFWVNDFLNRICGINYVLNDYTPTGKVCGKLFVGLANPSNEAIRKISIVERKTSKQVLTRLLALKKEIAENDSFDYVIFDTSPGLNYLSITNIITADLVLVITSIDKSDLLGTRNLINELNDLFEKKSSIIINKVPNGMAISEMVQELDSRELPIIETVDCSCDILKAGGNYLFSLNNPLHPFTQKVSDVATKIENMDSEKLEVIKKAYSRCSNSIHY